MARAETSLSRFLVNTVLGVGGLFDAASGFGLAYHDEDVGQTLATYGIDARPYLVLPLLGASNPPAAFASAVGWLIDPVRLGAEAAAGAEAVSGRRAP